MLVSQPIFTHNYIQKTYAQATDYISNTEHNLKRLSIGHLFFRHSRGTQLPNLSGNSEMRSSLMRSLSGPRMTTGRVYFTEERIRTLILKSEII